MTKQCQYENGTYRCKTWVPNADDDDQILCATHAGLIRKQPNNEELEFQKRFDSLVTFCDSLSDDELIAHSLKLEAELEAKKLEIQANARVRLTRAKLKSQDEERETIAHLRDPHKTVPVTKQAEPKQTKMEKEIAKMLKLGMNREMALKVLGLE